MEVAKSHKVTCPKCDHAFNATEGFDEHLKKLLRADLKKELIAEKEIAVAEAVANAKLENNADLLKKWQNESREKLQILQDKQNLKAEMKSLQETSDLKLQTELAKQKTEIETAAEIKLKEADLRADRLLSQVDGLKKSGTQGSMELQGEASELHIEGKLRKFFPRDIVSEIPKGTQGADCFLSIKVANGHDGSVFFESKNTKSFQYAWIKKIKKDQAQAQADYAVIVTSSWPKDAELSMLHIRDGVYICRPHEFLGLAFILRDAIKRVAIAGDLKERRADVQSRLFNYFTSTQFQLEFKQVFEPIEGMFEDLNREKRANAAKLKKREQQLEQIMIAGSTLYGTLSGIHDGIPAVEFFELDNQS